MITTQARNAQLVFGYDEFIGAWVRERVKEARFEEFKTIGVALGDRLIAGFVYYDYRPDYQTMEMSMAADSPMWARPGTIRALLHYPFIQQDCYKVRVVIASDNQRSIKNTKHIGFKQEGVLGNEFGKGRHAVIMRMYRPAFEKLYGGKDADDLRHWNTKQTVI